MELYLTKCVVSPKTMYDKTLHSAPSMRQWRHLVANKVHCVIRCSTSSFIYVCEVGKPAGSLGICTPRMSIMYLPTWACKCHRCKERTSSSFPHQVTPVSMSSTLFVKERFEHCTRTGWTCLRHAPMLNLIYSFIALVLINLFEIYYVFD